ncbi:MAG TPA: serine protease [Casimicrobiaceae bacterium]|nr:serine protease [Casimicrobiaceae bacterium]
MNPRRSLRQAAALIAAIALVDASAAHAQSAEASIARVKESIVAVGTFERTRAPQFQFRGTGFAVGDGTLIATNAHVLPPKLADAEQLAVLVPARGGEGTPAISMQVRVARPAAVDAKHDIGVLKVDGPALPALALGESASVREGRSVYFTGFPIGTVLGFYPATHRAMVAAITPIAIPQATSSQINAAVAKRLSQGAFPVFQLDGTAYPGNSGSPVYETGGETVIAVINMVLARATKESLLTQPSGIVYAIPVEHLRALLSTVR